MIHHLLLKQSLRFEPKYNINPNMDYPEKKDPGSAGQQGDIFKTGKEVSHHPPKLHSKKRKRVPYEEHCGCPEQNQGFVLFFPPVARPK